MYVSAYIYTYIYTNPLENYIVVKIKKSKSQKNQKIKLRKYLPQRKAKLHHLKTQKKILRTLQSLT